MQKPIHTQKQNGEDTSNGTPTKTQNGHLVQRYIWFVVGLLINSFGIAFITSSGLGTSPISSIPYVLDLAFEPSFGEFTFALNMIFIVLQIVLLRRDFKPVQLLQVVANLLFSSFLDISMSLLWWVNPTTLVAQIASLIVGCCILALGLTIEVAPNVLYVPGEGIVHALASVLGRPFGTCKVCFDVTLALIAVVLSFVFFGELRGLGAGTIVAALIVGQITNVINRHLPLVARIAGLSRSATGAPEEAL